MATTTAARTTAQAGRVQWIYHVSRVHPVDMEGYTVTMAELGRQGWELVSATALSLHGWLSSPQGATNELMLIWKKQV